MPKTTEKELILKLQTLKDIKPRQDWVVFAKREILGGNKITIKASYKEKFLGVLDFLPALTYQRKLTYAFATLLLIMVGTLGFAQYTMPGDLLFSVKKVTEQSQAALSGQTNLRQNMANLSNRIGKRGAKNKTITNINRFDRYSGDKKFERCFSRFSAK